MLEVIDCLKFGRGRFAILVIVVSTFAFAFVLFRLMVFLKKGFSENCSFVGLLLRIELVLIHAVAILNSISKLFLFIPFKTLRQ